MLTPSQENLLNKIKEDKSIVPFWAADQTLVNELVAIIKHQDLQIHAVYDSDSELD